MTTFIPYFNMQKILILGDSTASSIGRNSKVWSRLLSERKIWGPGVEFIDTTCPGNTAASSLLTLIIQLFKFPKRIAAVVLYVGNCDRITRPYETNRFTLLTVFIRFLQYQLDFGKTKRFEWNKLMPYEWNETINKNLEKIPNVNDFAKMLKYIKYICIILRIKLIVIVPKSNQNFTPGTAKGNFLYYNTLGFECNWKSIEKSGLYEVLNCDSNLDLHSQISNIKSLINLSANSEKIYCAINNYAVNLANSGRLFEAKILLGSLINDESQRVEIFLFNLSKIEHLLGNLELSSNLLDLALSKDRSSYRIDDIYSDKILEVMSKNRNITIIDLRQDSFQDYFLDHCHLTPEGQQLLSDKLEAELTKFIALGDCKSNVNIDILNPEIMNRDFREWRVFFGLFPAQFKEVLGEKNQIDTLFQDLTKFPHLLSASLLPDRFAYESADFGKFPEFFASKIFLLFSQTDSFSNSPEIQKRYKQEIFELNYLFNNLNINQYLPKGNFVSNLDLDKWILGICRSTCTDLIEISKMPSSKNLRLKTIMFWYFRESIMFGFQSEINSVYDRESFRRILEALFLAHSCLKDANPSLEAKILALIKISLDFEAFISNIHALGLNEDVVSDRLLKYRLDIEIFSNELVDL